MKPQEPPIFTASYDLARRIFEETMGFPKAQRFVIAQRLQNAVLAVLEGVVSAYSSRKKKRALERASEALERLRILVRLARELGFLTPKRTDLIQQRVDEIGRMLGGWIKEAGQKGQTDKGPRVARRVVEQQSEQRAVRQPQQQQPDE